MRKPREGSREWENGLASNPIYVKNTVADLSKRAAAGDKVAAERLEGWLARHPDLRPTVEWLADLPALVERAWVRALAGDDELRRAEVRKEVVALRASLLPAGPTVIDRVLVENVVAAYLAHQRATLAAAAPTALPGLALVRERRAASTQRRLDAALKTWRLIESRKAKGRTPKRKLKLFAGGAA